MNQEEIDSIFLETTLSFISYWFNFINVNYLDHGALDLEESNILLSLHKALEHDQQHNNLLTATHLVYPYFESRGLFNRIEIFLKAIHEKIEVDNIRNMLFLGRLMMKREKYAEALNYWENGLTLAEKSNQISLEAELQKELGVLAITERRYGDAKQYLIKGLKSAKRQNNSSLECIIKGELCRLYFLWGKRAKSKWYCQLGLNHAARLENSHLMTGLLLYRGVLEDAEDNTQKALVTLKEGITIAREVGNLERILYFLVNLGEYTNKLGKSTDAITYLTEGIEVARKLGNSQVLSHQMIDLGLVHGKAGAFHKSNSLFDESMIIAKSTSHVPLISYNLLKIGIFYFDHDQNAKALKVFNECASLIKVDEIVPSVKIRRAKAKFYMAKIYFDLGNILNAKEACRQCLDTLDSSKVSESFRSEVMDWLQFVQINLLDDDLV